MRIRKRYEAEWVHTFFRSKFQVAIFVRGGMRKRGKIDREVFPQKNTPPRYLKCSVFKGLSTLKTNFGLSSP